MVGCSETLVECFQKWTHKSEQFSLLGEESEGGKETSGCVSCINVEDQLSLHRGGGQIAPVLNQLLKFGKSQSPHTIDSVNALSSPRIKRDFCL